MTKHELETAIASGIFQGVIQIVMFLFVCWLFSPLLIPLAFVAQIFAVINWDKILVGLACGVLIVFTLWMVWTLLVDSNLGRWFQSRLSDQYGNTIVWKGVLLTLSFSALAMFGFFCYLSSSMTREFTTSDLSLLVVLFGLSLIGAVVSLWKTG